MIRSSCPAHGPGRAGKTQWEAIISSTVAIGTLLLGIFSWLENRNQSRTDPASNPGTVAVVVATPALAPTPTPAAKSPDPAAAPATDAPAASADPSVMPHPLKLSNGSTFYFYGSLAPEAVHPRVTRAVIVISNFHAATTADFFQGVMDQARCEQMDQEAMIVVPAFQTAPAPLRSEEPYWPSNWEFGAESAGKHPISSFQVIDELFARITDPHGFPSLRTVVVAGNSQAGTFVNRYLAAARPIIAGADSGRTLDVRYLVIAAGSYLYLDPCRPVAGTDRFAVPDAAACADFAAYPYGLDARAGHIGRFSARILRDNMMSRRAIYVVGMLDTKPDRLDLSCAAMLQGKDRYERALNYWNYIQRSPEWKEHVDFVPLKQMKHLSIVTTDSKTVRALLFGARPTANRSTRAGAAAPISGKPAGAPASGPHH